MKRFGDRRRFDVQAALRAATWVAAGWIASGAGQAETVDAQVAAKAAAALPAKTFFRHAAMSDAVLSPDGSHIAAIVAGSDGRHKLAVIDLADLTASKAIASFDDADIARVWWVNDRRLVFNLVDLQTALGRQDGQGLFAIDREGAEPLRRLIQSRWSFVRTRARVVDRTLDALHTFFSTLRDGSDDVVVQKAMFDSNHELSGLTLLRVDTVTGRSRSISDGSPPRAVDWALDRAGNPRAVETASDGISQLWWKPAADRRDWKLLGEQPTFGAGFGALEVLAVDADNHLYAARRTGSGTAADATQSAKPAEAADTTHLARFAVENGKLVGEPLVTLKSYDFAGALVFGANGTVLGVNYISDAPASFWFDARLKVIQQRVDALLPATNNRLDCGACNDPKLVLVRSTADRQPAVFHLYDTGSGQLQPFAASRPWIDPKLMAHRDLLHYTARDGLDIPVHVTRPLAATGPLPAVVLVHGGPWVRGGVWSWYPESQFLASRGYLVIEPEYRGSLGFGQRHFQSSFKQWGLAMQDDLVDAERWAVAQGLADPQRVCIAGASYGGYATLMGLIRDPDVWRCGIEWAGVSDIDLMYTSAASDFTETYKRYGMPVMVGDRVRDTAQLVATSPLQQASRLTRPLLMAHGADDRRVPIEHASAFRDAVKRAHPDAELEYVVYPGEAHGFMLTATEVDFWGRVERFLARHDGPLASVNVEAGPSPSAAARR